MLHVGLSAEQSLFSVLTVEVLDGTIVMMDWTNALWEQWYLPKTSASQMRPPPLGW